MGVMVTDTMAILMATATETTVIGIVVIMVQGVTPVTGDKLIEAFPCSVDIATPIIPTYLFPRPSQVSALPSSRKAGFTQAGEIRCRERIYAFPTVFTSFDPYGNK